MTIDELLETGKGIFLDIGCGANCSPAFVGMDIRKLPGVDIVQDVNVHPWPLPDESVRTAVASHLLEHIPPVAIGPEGTFFPFVNFMNELWRVMKPLGQFAIAVPHGSSQGFQQDPTHINMINEATWDYFCPERESGLYWIYQPKPWRVRLITSNPAGNMEVILIRLAEGDE